MRATILPVSTDDVTTTAEVLSLVALIVVLVLEIGLRLLVLGIIPRGRKPSVAMAWLLLLYIDPIVGLVVFRLFGSTRLGRKRHERHRQAHERIAAATEGLPRPLDDLPAVSPGVRTAARLNRRLGAFPVTEGNDVELIADYHRSLAAMAETIDGARSFVHVEFYITAWDDATDPVFQALVRATERGVDVRLLFDHLGSRGIPGYQTMLERLEETRIEWYRMLPIQPLKRRWRRPDLRNHRKILVVDGEVAFTGSQNLVEPGYDKPKNHQAGREWVDLMMRVRGPSVAALSAVFAGDWYVETGSELSVVVPPPVVLQDTGREPVLAQVLPSGPGFPDENNLRMFTTLIYGAEHRLRIVSPYFVPDESLLYAVTTAAQRGVDVELFVSEQADQFMVGHAQASYYEDLLTAGVRIWLYPAPQILHTKCFSVDDAVAVVSTSNMDQRSFALNYEVTMMLVGDDAVARLNAVEDSYRHASRPLEPEEWQGRSFGQRWLDNVMRLTAALQ